MADQQDTTSSADVQQQQEQVEAVADTTAQPAHAQETAVEQPADDIADLRKQLEKLNAENRKLKQENGQRRVTAKEVEEKNQKLRRVAQVLGLGPEDDDPEALLRKAQQEAEERAKELDALQAKLDHLHETDHLRSLAKTAGADPDVLVPYLRGVGTLPEWGEDGYDGKAAEAIKTALETYPAMAATRVSYTSGNAPTPTEVQEKITVDDLKKMSSEDIYKAQKAGKLNHLLGK